MKFRIFLSVAAIVAATGQLHAQYATDALRFSQMDYGSTARFKGMGGAQIGVGGDLSSLAANPAGLGLFTRGEFSLTPEFNNYSTDASYLGGISNASKDQLNLAHAGAVWNFPVYRRKGEDLQTGWLSYSAGIGYSRTNDFNNQILFRGTNPSSSIADFFADQATANFGDPNTLTTGSLEGMAYEDYLIDYENNAYVPVTRFNNNQNRSETRGGSQSEVNFALGANYSNKFYLGASLNLSTLKYTSDAEYTETGIADIQDNQVFNAYDYALTYRQNQITDGDGVNGKIGAIYRPVESVRLGLTFQTPTYYNINDSYAEVLNTRYTPGLPTPPVGNDQQIYDFSYRLRTPAKVSAGASFFFGTSGFISADLDYMDYSKINFSTKGNVDAATIAENNQAVRDSYQSAVNYRIGGEYRLDQMTLRAGYGLRGNPYRNENREISTYSGGIGYRFSGFYLDVSYQHNSYDSEIRPYVMANGAEPVAAIDNKRNNVFLTLGARF